MLLFFVVHHFFIKTPGSIEQIASYALYPVLIMQKKIITPFKNYRQRKQEQKDIFKNFLDLQENNQSL